MSEFEELPRDDFFEVLKNIRDQGSLKNLFSPLSVEIKEIFIKSPVLIEILHGFIAEVVGLYDTARFKGLSWFDENQVLLKDKVRQIKELTSEINKLNHSLAKLKKLCTIFVEKHDALARQNFGVTVLDHPLNEKQYKKFFQETPFEDLSCAQVLSIARFQIAQTEAKVIPHLIRVHKSAGEKLKSLSDLKSKLKQKEKERLIGPPDLADISVEELEFLSIAFEPSRSSFKKTKAIFENPTKTKKGFKSKPVSPSLFNSFSPNSPVFPFKPKNVTAVEFARKLLELNYEIDDFYTKLIMLQSSETGRSYHEIQAEMVKTFPTVLQNPLEWVQSNRESAVKLSVFALRFEHSKVLIKIWFKELVIKSKEIYCFQEALLKKSQSFRQSWSSEISPRILDILMDPYLPCKIDFLRQTIKQLESFSARQAVLVNFTNGCRIIRGIETEARDCISREAKINFEQSVFKVLCSLPRIEELLIGFSEGHPESPFEYDGHDLSDPIFEQFPVKLVKRANPTSEPVIIEIPEEHRDEIQFPIDQESPVADAGILL